ncbi:uncharacterized protein LOC134266631 [Saccostrea cucullata]|uniref:uncharacterized protein LOC134266631 n=1 Tax=Saccostrea cuccullata TaxID=36930 RepID=UPI002ED66CB3
MAPWRRDEDFLHIQNEYHKVEQNVRALNIKIRDEQDRYLKLDEANKEIAKERDEFKDRFSKLAGAKLTAGNARIQDLSDINRPQKLGEKYSELYDNEWTDALEEIQENEDLNEKEAVMKLLDLFKSCVSFCQMRAEEQEMRFMSAVRQAVDLNMGGAVCNGSGEGPEQESDRHILSPSDSKMLKDFLKAKGGTTLTYLQRVFQTEYPTYAESGPKVQEFLNQSIEVCWFSAIQDPPLAFDWNFPEGSEMIDKYVKVFTKSGSKIDFVVWPVMKLHVDGDVLCKGVIQPIPEGKTKKKKKDSES